MSPGDSRADRIAFEALFEEHHRAVLAYALRRTRIDADAEDVVAETFAIAWRRLDSLPDDALPWLFGVARRVLANQRRGAARRVRLFERLSTWRSEPTVTPSHEPAIEAFERLRPDDQELLRLVAWEDLSNAEIAIALDITPNAVAIRLHQARKRFADALAEVRASTGLKGSEASRTPPSVKGRVGGMWRRGSER